MTKAIGLTPIIQYMYGFPGEDDSSIEKTYDFFKEIDSPYMGFTTTPLPGTEIYNEALGRGLIGDEEEYLKKITAGYNLFSPVINMTSFNNEEFVSKKLALMKKVNRRYYSRHPLVYLRTAARAAWQTALFQFSNPGRFLRRLMARLSLA
jgi:radical SAM superfamily enzyme YgiQ (UPF0313 family)